MISLLLKIVFARAKTNDKGLLYPLPFLLVCLVARQKQIE